jgi:DNA repair photolyase
MSYFNKNEAAFPKEFRTKPGLTKDRKPYDWMVKEQVRKGNWRLEVVPAELLGLKHPLEVFRGRRHGHIIKPWLSSSRSGTAYCPAYWADLAIGRGDCGLRCRACFLIGTHRNFCDPSRHVVYENVEDYEKAVRKWLLRPNRRNLGLGIDCSDSLLYEGVTGHAQRLIPIFSDPEANPFGCKLILLTKTTNIGYLKNLPSRNVLVTFSLNPEAIADLFEGKYPDGVRTTPSINERIVASNMVQGWGFEVRWRIDPILPAPDWEDKYYEFFLDAVIEGCRPTRLTLGTYREMKRSLLTCANRWGLGEMGWTPPNMDKDGSHWHIPREERVYTYKTIKSFVEDAWSSVGHKPIVALCKETLEVRKQAGIDHAHCNCE